jgi:hypothetical protein
MAVRQAAVTFALFAQRTYLIVIKRRAVIAEFKQHEAELKRLGIEHLFLFGLTARDEAPRRFRRRSFLRSYTGPAEYVSADGVKEFAPSILGGEGGNHDVCQPAPGLAGVDRSFGAASVLIVSLIPRLTDVIEAIERIESETAVRRGQ